MGQHKDILGIDNWILIYCMMCESTFKSCPVQSISYTADGWNHGLCPCTYLLDVHENLWAEEWNKTDLMYQVRQSQALGNVKQPPRAANLGCHRREDSCCLFTLFGLYFHCQGQLKTCSNTVIVCCSISVAPLMSSFSEGWRHYVSWQVTYLHKGKILWQESPVNVSWN